MSYTLVAAMDCNGLIGADGDLPWRLPRDLQLFKQNTMGRKILMGRKTRDSLKGPLPGRKNYVLSRSSHSDDGFIYIRNPAYLDFVEEEIMVIGGGAIYGLFIDRADRMILTHINDSFEGDTYFPEWSSQDWEIIESQHYPADERNSHEFKIVKYLRKTP